MLAKIAVIFPYLLIKFVLGIKAKELISKIKSYFKNHVDFPENVDDFLASFKKYISDKNNFKKLLTGSIVCF